MFRRFTKKRTAVALAAVASLIVAGGAIAYFTSTGTGSGTGTVGTATNWTVAGGSVVGTLYPDSSFSGPDQGVVTGASVTNPATAHGNQNLNKVIATISSVTQGTTVYAGQNPCSVTDFQFNSPSATGQWTGSGTQTATILPNTDLAPGSSYSVSNLNVVMVDNGHAQDNCQGASVTVTLDAS